MKLRKESGASIVEFALIAPIFFLLIFAIIEFGLLFWVDLTMQHAVREGARYAITGQVNLDPNTSDQQRYRAIIAKMNESSVGLWAKVDPDIKITLNGTTSTEYSDANSYNAGMFGQAGDIVTIQLDCKWPMFTGFISKFFSNGEHDFHVAATMRNEAF